MPKLNLGLEAAKAKDADILAKLSKVQHAAQNSKQQTKLNQQRLEWTEQAKRLAVDARRIEDDLQEVSIQLGVCRESPANSDDRNTADAWFQVAGVRKLLAQVRQRDVGRLRNGPDQALLLEDVLCSVVLALGSLGGELSTQAAELERECGASRRALRQELSAEGVWSIADRHAGIAPSGAGAENLSDDEDALLERIGDGPEAYESELRGLNDQVTNELSELEKEIGDLRRKRKGWDDEAHNRFVSIKQQLQARRDLLMDRLCLEFPHLNREQLLEHETLCDALKYATQKQTAAFRQWRRDRLALLRRQQGKLEERLRSEEAVSARRHDVQDQREKQKQLHGKLQVQRARASSIREERQRGQEELDRKRIATEAGKEQANRRRAQSVKCIARDFGEKKREQLVHKEELAADRERREADETRIRLERCAEVVRLRRKMDDLKQREIEQKRAAAEQDRREREHRLEQAIEKLRVEAPRDPERLLKVPERTRAEAYNDPLVCVLRGPACGFLENKLMGDARYKLSAALQRAGLYNTPAGHEILAKVAAPRPMQPTLVSNVFSSGYPT